MADPLHLLIIPDLAEGLIARIRAEGGARVEVEALRGAPRRLAAGGSIADAAEAAAARRELDRAFAATHILYSQIRLPADIYERAPKLKWVQLAGAGVDRLIDQGLVRDGIPVTNCSGVHTVPIGEWVLAAMLSFAKGLPTALAAQRRHEWSRFPARELRDATCGVIGMGAIGAEVVRLASAFGMRVLATRWSATAESEEGGVRVLPRTGLPRLLAESDYVVLAVPLTAQTRRLIGPAELAAMKPGAVLVNIARGEVVDEAALIAALRDGPLGGAALDVFEREPLDPGSPLWDMANVLVSAHNSPNTPRYNERAVDIFTDNLRRFLDGKPLRNLVDPVRGY